MATDQSYAVIFDKSSDLIMLYANPKYDKSDDVLLKMGYKAGAKNTGGESKTGGSQQQPPASGGEERQSEKK